MAQLMQLVQHTARTLKGRREEAKQYLHKLSDGTQEQYKMVKDHTTSVESYLANFNKQVQSLQSTHEQSTKDLSDIIQQSGTKLLDDLESVGNGQRAMTTDMQAVERMVERGWQQHTTALEKELRDYAEGANEDLQSVGTHVQVSVMMQTRLSHMAHASWDTGSETDDIA